MRYLIIPLLAATIFLSSAPAHADLGDQLTKLLANDGAANDVFGWSIAIENGIVAIGARSDDDNGINSGSAYLFDAASGKQIAKLTSDDGAAGDSFGWSIAINNGVVAVGARLSDDNGSNSGSAYLFSASTGDQITKLLPNDGSADDKFGHSIAINNGIVAVGAINDDDNGNESGSVYLFNASTGAQLAKFIPNDGAAFDIFGWSIAIDKSIVAVAAQLDDDNGNESGSAYLFDISDPAIPTQLFKLLAKDGAEDDRFGYSISISNNVVAIGVRRDDDNGTNSGSAYLFDASTGAQLAKLLPNDGAAFDSFGFSIAIDNGIVGVGAHEANSNSGSAYLFNTSTGVQIAKLLPNDGA